jgi:exosortase
MNQSSGNVYSTDTPQEGEKGWSSLGPAVYIKTAIIAVLFWFLFRDEISRVVYRWVTNSSWSHGFLIPLFSLYFLNQHKQQILQIEVKRSYFGLFFLLCCLVFYPLNIVLFKVGYARPLVVVASLGAVVLFLSGWRIARYCWLPVLYLVFAVPLPDRIYRQFTIPMRKLAAQVATVILGFVPDLQADASGVVINVIYKGVNLEPGLDVAEACSGMRLLMAFLALGVAMAYLHYRPAWQRLILLCSTIPIAIACNVVRVTVTGFIYILGNPKYAQGIWHDGLGMLMLPLAFGLYGFLAWIMSNLFVEERTVSEDVVVRRRDGE